MGCLETTPMQLTNPIGGRIRLVVVDAALGACGMLRFKDFFIHFTLMCNNFCTSAALCGIALCEHMFRIFGFAIH
jgi:hypothetical protein